MIWTSTQVDETLRAAFQAAGPIDQRAIETHLARQREKGRPQYAPNREGIPRYYYLLQEDPRISLVCVSMPLDSWQGGAFFIVGTRQIIGEFAGNKHLTGRRGLQLKMQPIAWMEGTADREFQTGVQLLSEISQQVLDSQAIERSQQRLRKKYEWR